jgi:hypothetical protein
MTCHRGLHLALRLLGIARKAKEKKATAKAKAKRAKQVLQRVRSA